MTIPAPHVWAEIYLLYLALVGACLETVLIISGATHNLFDDRWTRSKHALNVMSCPDLPLDLGRPVSRLELEFS